MAPRSSSNSDEVEVDAEEIEFQEVLKRSLESYNEQQKRTSHASRRASSSVAAAGPSTSRPFSIPMNNDSIQSRLEDYDARISAVRQSIKALQKEEKELVQGRNELLALQKENTSNALLTASLHSSGSSGATTDYFASDFEWSGSMKAKLNEVFGIKSYRLCQEGVCNANMDRRDIVCVMPTGGGKSLTYQLPAIMSRGCTLVVSPLISLMTDQIIHLREFGVMAVMLTSTTSKAEALDINQRLDHMARAGAQSEEDIRLCYVTPEKMAQSKGFQAKMQKLADVNKLARIVIDEAHCISEQGHDFRKDYLLLSSCKKLWPRVPILALSATCPPAVLRDVLKVLGLKSIVNGHAAPAQGTLYFTSPLYRKNLHYKVLPKPSSSAQLIKEITKYILDHHPNDTGIIYCFSRKDSETVAEAIRKESDNKIRTGVYHSDVTPGAKSRLHEQWRKGDVKVVCATIAFGLGIDKGDVRFVIHHTLSKSLDGFYQESGRAGRDGKDADCILYYRPQDGQNLCSHTVVENTALARLHEMLRFAQNLDQCRKVHFAKYFNASSRLDTASWTTAEEDALSPCGHCDNCTREKEAAKTEDVTVAAWRILTIVETVHKERGRVTLSQLADMARGTGNGEFKVPGRGKRSKGTTSSLDKDSLDGEVVKLSKEHAEWLCVHLLLEGYLKEAWASTPYSVNTYVEPGVRSYRVTGRSFAQVKDGGGERICCTFLQKVKKSTRKQSTTGNVINSDVEPDTPPVQGGSAKRKRRVPPSSSSPVVDSDEDTDVLLREVLRSSGDPSNSSDDEDIEWSHGLRNSASRKRPRRGKKAAKEIIELSSD